tara:strand:- start:699 stop:866 length:168 start_codon:yes stop_codon:yes gene_type:complete
MSDGTLIDVWAYCRDCGEDGPKKKVRLKGEEPTKEEKEMIRRMKAWWCLGCIANF